MKALQWDCMTLEERWRLCRVFDFGDIEGGPATWIDRPWPALPGELKACFKLLRRVR